MTTRKIIVVPCMVKTWLYASALRKVLLGDPSWIRSSRASMPPIMKNKKAVAEYMMPIFLWSTVVIQFHTPCGWVGRRRRRTGAGRADPGGGGSSAGLDGWGEVTIAMRQPPIY